MTLRGIGGEAWFLLACVSVGLLLGAAPLIDPDEGRNALTASEMARSGDFVVPHLNGLPHLDKPVLFYAAGALAMRALGVSEMPARLPSLLAAWATAALIFGFSIHLFGRRSAWVAGTACVTAPLAIGMARTVIFDSFLSFFMVLALVAFYRAIEAEPQPRGWRERGWLCLGWAGIAGGILSKGPVALLLPLLVAAPYAVWRRRARALWHPLGWLSALALTLPWVWAVETRVPGFLRYALVTETWSRLTTDEMRRNGPLWYFLPVLLGGCFPWVVVVLASARERWRETPASERRPVVYLALWILLPLIFFSLSSSKRPQYILPLAGACALLTAWAWNGERPPSRGVRVAGVGWLVLGGALLAAPTVSRRGIAMLDALSDAARPTALALGAAMIAAGLLAWVVARWRGGAAVVPLSLPLVLLTTVASPLAVDLASARSAKSLAVRLAPLLGPEARVVGVETFSPSLAFYLGQPIEVSSHWGEPFRSTYIARNVAASMARPGATLHPPGWWSESIHACSPPRIYLARTHNEAVRSALEAAGHQQLFEDARFVAFGPCPPNRPQDSGASR